MISESYLEQQKILHENPEYGVASLAFAPTVAKIIRANDCKSLCDYGAGKKNLQKVLNQSGLEFVYHPYDPVFPEYGPPRAADLVCCIDVLEHVEPEFIDAVLADLQRIMPKIGFLSIHTQAAVKVLPDGRNAHLTIEPASWWLPKLCRYFEIHQLQTHRLMGQGFWVLVSAKTPAE
jgi:hypothetical protein